MVAKLLDRTLHGTAAGIDADGALWIRHDNGLQERILSGDIQHLRKHDPTTSKSRRKEVVG